MKILITGSDGFIAKNLAIKLKTYKDYKIYKYNRKTKLKNLIKYIKICDFIFHLAGSNRPLSNKKFYIDNNKLTKKITDLLIKYNKNTPIIFSSSTKSNLNTHYGISKKFSENIIKNYIKKTKSKSTILKIPNVFGKWCKPNYNSVVATFCYNLNRNFEININKNEINKKLNLIHIDDLIDYLLKIIHSYPKKIINKKFISKIISLKKLSELLIRFKDNVDSNHLPEIKNSFEKKLYSTYLSYLQRKEFTKSLKLNIDDRGNFAEIFKNKNFGQVSYFTIKSGKVRGNHYHNTKNEIFLVLTGKVKFNILNLINNVKFSYTINAKDNKIIRMPSGYNHSIKNIGKTESIIIVWANEIFNKKNDDTITMK